jgi:hypothetical protein
MDLITQVAAADFACGHPELHHYTNFDGLSGIYASRTLWAVNYRHLNDTREIARRRAAASIPEALLHAAHDVGPCRDRPDRILCIPSAGRVVLDV